MFLEPASSAYFLSDFPLVPPLKNFKKWPILVSLRNWPLLGIEGTFRAAVCSDNVVPQTAALKVPSIPSNGQFRKDTKIGHFLKFFKGGTKGKSLKK